MRSIQDVLRRLEPRHSAQVVQLRSAQGRKAKAEEARRAERKEEARRKRDEARLAKEEAEAELAKEEVRTG